MDWNNAWDSDPGSDGFLVHPLHLHSGVLLLYLPALLGRLRDVCRVRDHCDDPDDPDVPDAAELGKATSRQPDTELCKVVQDLEIYLSTSWSAYETHGRFKGRVRHFWVL